MKDGYNREINYLRLSLTDRCNLRCRYCMPRDAQLTRPDELLTFEELLRVCREAVELGIRRFKITGGEPLVREGCVDFLTRLKTLPGVEQVTLTTNGVALEPWVETLAALPVDGINISLDSLDPSTYQALTRSGPEALPAVLRALEKCVRLGVATKINAVLIRSAMPGLSRVLELASRYPVDVRLIELMPIGEGAGMERVSAREAMELCRGLYPDLRPSSRPRGNGPARYYTAQGLLGAVGFIDSVSHGFCDQCNRVRLTATGLLKPCLCYENGVELKPLLRGGASRETLLAAMRECIWNKPAAHCFIQPREGMERQPMNRIGG